MRMEWNKGLKRITLQQQREGVVSAHVDAIMHGRPLREGGGVGGVAGEEENARIKLGAHLAGCTARIHGGGGERRISVRQQQPQQLAFVPRRKFVNCWVKCEQ